MIGTESSLRFSKVGLAYRAVCDDGTFLWIRRNDGQGVDLIWQRRNPLGRIVCVRLGKHRTIAGAVEDANALYFSAG
jgi:hypothetical protein